MAGSAPSRGAARGRTGTPASAGPRGLAEHVAARLAVWDTPATSYYLVLGVTICLVSLGLVMVLSSSSVTSLGEGGSAFSVFLKQAVFAAMGIPLLWGCSRIPVAVWKRLAFPLVIVAAVGQALVVFTPLGVGKGGNKNWLALGPVAIQPSEAAKLALVVCIAAILARTLPRVQRTGKWLPVMLPVGAVVAGILGLVLIGHDLGTSLVMMLLVAVMLFVAGLPLRWFGVAGLAGVGLAAVLVLISPNRIARINTWLSGSCTDIYGACWQSTHGKWALASGGLWGLGLGASREKWDWLPAAHNDYIYAIIGEELGLPGTITILLLLALLALAGLRVIQRHDDAFVKIATGGVLAWVIGQALMNIGVVLGLLPVIGVPLPLVSSGGSALITTLAALGVLLSFARSEPGAAVALQARVGQVRSSLTRVRPSGPRRLSGRA